MNDELKSPVTFQGAKVRLASQIVDVLWAGKDTKYFDLCCGGGSISLQLFRRGVPPENITMVDAGPWGDFWRAIASGSFDLGVLRMLLDMIPKDRSKIRDHIERLSNTNASVMTPYVYLLLQASSFGGKAIWREGDKWKNTTFRGYWEPKDGCNRQSPVNPMMPMPDELYRRVEAIVRSDLYGRVRGCRCVLPECMEELGLIGQGVAYIDPPYKGATGYGRAFDVVSAAKRFDGVCYVSEGVPLTKEAHRLSEHRQKGGVSGKRERKQEEWISVFRNKDQ